MTLIIHQSELPLHPISFELTPTWGIDATDQTLIGLNINPNTNGNTDSGDVLEAISITNITGTVGTETAIDIGTGWDSGLSIGGTVVIDGSGNVAASQLSGTLITVAGDSGSQAVSQGNTFTIVGGTNLSTTGAAGPQVQVDLNNSITLSGDLTVQGQNVNFDNATDIDIDDNLTDSLTISVGADNYLDIDSNNGTEGVSFGNAVTNPSFSFLGSGEAAFTGNVNANSGVDVTGADLTVGGANFSVAFGNGNITTAGTLAVNGDQITSDGNLVINATSTDIQDPLTADSLTLDTGALAINNAGGITSNQATLIVNAGGNVDVQDALNADSITSDAGVSIAAGNAYTGAGAVTLSSGAGALTLDANNGNVTLNTDDDLFPTLGAGDADLGASGTRWDNLFAVAGNFSGNVDVASGVDITGANLTVGATNFVVTVGSGNVDTQGTIQAGSGNITLTDATGNIQAGAYALASIDGDDLNSNLAGNGLTLTAGSPDVLNIALDSAAADGSTTSSISGLEFDSGELTLIRGCGANQILKWDNINFEWDCADDDDTGGTVSLDSAYNQRRVHHRRCL